MDAPDVRTHRGVDRRLCGEPLSVSPGAARVALATLPEMAVDETGLVHGGFVFGLADHAAMLAVNRANVVLGSAEVRFERPVVVGDRLVADAWVEETSERKRFVRVLVAREGQEGSAVFSGRFVCLVPERHVLAPRPAGRPLTGDPREPPR
jgi:acyl-coenzyme A thioesterase PaaI-like protein